MSYLANCQNKRKVQIEDTSSSMANKIAFTKLHLSRVSKAGQKGILITLIEEESKTTTRIPLKLEHPGNFGHLQLSYGDPIFKVSFPPDATIKISEILLKKSITRKKKSLDNVQKDVLGNDDWNIVHIITKNKSDCNYLCNKAIKDKYTIILAMQLEVIHPNNLLQKFILYSHSVKDTLLYQAAVEKDKKVINAVLKYKDNLERTVVHHAVLKDDISTLNYLLETNVTVNAAEDSEEIISPHLVINLEQDEKLRIRCLKILVDHKADINAVDNNSTSPLHLACFAKKAKAVKYLIENGADSSIRDKNGRTVFHYVCMRKFKGMVVSLDEMRESIKDILGILFEENISVNCVDKFGKTPLHYVAEDKCLPFMHELLLNIGVDINIEDRNHKSPFDIFIKRRNLLWRSASIEQPLVELYKSHVLKMDVLKLSVRKRFLDEINQAEEGEAFEWIHLYLRAFYREMYAMKRTKIGQSNLTYYDFLTKGQHKVLFYIRNQNIVEAIQSNELEKMFHFYNHFFKCHLREVQRRSNLYEKIEEMSDKYIFRKLPTDCMYEIFQYLDVSDLNILLEAMKPVDLAK